MLEVRDLQVLAAFARTGSVAAAAAELSYVHSAVSQRLRRLERETGVRLLERRGRRLFLTVAGQGLVRDTEHILDLLASAQQALGREAAARGTVRLAAFPSAVATVVPAALRRLRASHPDLRVEISGIEPYEGLPALRAGVVDVAIVHTYKQVPVDFPPRLTVHELLCEPLVAVLPRGHERAGRELRVADLAGERWILGRPDTAWHRAVVRACRAAGFEPDAIAQTDDIGATLALVDAGVGVALVPRSGLPNPMPAGVAQIRPEAPWRKVFVMTRAAIEHVPAVATLIDALAHSSEDFSRIAGAGFEQTSATVPRAY